MCVHMCHVTPTIYSGDREAQATVKMAEQILQVVLLLSLLTPLSLSSLRRFFRVRLYNVQLQYARIPPPPPSSNHSNKVVGGATKIKPSKKRRLLNHVLRQASRVRVR